MSSSIDHLRFGNLFRVAILPIGLRQRGTFDQGCFAFFALKAKNAKHP